MSDHTWTLEEQKAHRKLWVEALRSGKYEQGKDRLYADDRFCCLGVACMVVGKQAEDLAASGTLRDFPDVREFFGLVTDVGDFGEDALTARNDKGSTFQQIADIIESEPLGLFTDARATGECK